MNYMLLTVLSFSETHTHTHTERESDHEELAEGDMGEDVVCLILATGEAGLLPEEGELLQQRPAGSQI